MSLPIQTVSLSVFRIYPSSVGGGYANHYPSQDTTSARRQHIHSCERNRRQELLAASSVAYTLIGLVTSLASGTSALVYSLHS